MLKQIDTLEDELVELCQDLIRIPSWDRETRGEADCSRRVGKTLEKREFSPNTLHPIQASITWLRHACEYGETGSV